ncbi:LAS superfamily LD-carboxypeptidase LdcB [Rheinheimera pacifica]|uniref:M15 family metallopeptidase n=1 Tax=Rheinheimera pacifica TaxID=173990 RepID=UPI00216AA905|nr:M15 family metallopeptidase [Rheinheimera pacifica]MCS4307618.1 LAS superfamily LD-carboxypeptidase LdcB [Rheinheimera pacifica]
MIDCSDDILTGLSEQHLLKRPDGFMLHKDIAQPFTALCIAAKTEGIEITLVSAFRSYQRQAAIWQAKLAGKRPVYAQDGQAIDINSLTGKAKLDAVLLYSALPGASRHHWGTDLDVYDAAAVPPDYKPQLEPAEYGEDGPFYRLQQWLSAYAADFGFFLPYREFQGGVAAEPWHISYQPLASAYLANFNSTLLRQCLTQHPVAEQQLVLTHLDAIFQRYVANICLAAP